MFLLQSSGQRFQRRISKNRDDPVEIEGQELLGRSGGIIFQEIKETLRSLERHFLHSECTLIFVNTSKICPISSQFSLFTFCK